jgi:hypothetical protein
MRIEPTGGASFAEDEASAVAARYLIALYNDETTGDAEFDNCRTLNESARVLVRRIAAALRSERIVSNMQQRSHSTNNLV